MDFLGWLPDPCPPAPPPETVPLEAGGFSGFPQERLTESKTLLVSSPRPAGPGLPVPLLSFRKQALQGWDRGVDRLPGPRQAKWLTGAYRVDAYAFINQLSGHWSRG